MDKIKTTFSRSISFSNNELITYTHKMKKILIAFMVRKYY